MSKNQPPIQEQHQSHPESIPSHALNQSPTQIPPPPNPHLASNQIIQDRLMQSLEGNRDRAPSEAVKRMDLQLSMIGEKEWEYSPLNLPVIEAPEIPQLEMGMQTMRITEQDSNLQSQEEESKFNLFMKIACTGGNPRAISLGAVQQSMTRA